MSGRESWIWVTLQQEGIHYYPQALTDPKLKTGNWDDVSFLGHPHRHIFHVKVEIQVFHDDRELEFIQVKRQIQRWIGDGTLEFNHKSCEMIAGDIMDQVETAWGRYRKDNGDYVARKIKVTVSEDGENGATLIKE